MLEVFSKKLLLSNKSSKKKLSFTSSAPDTYVGDTNVIEFTCEDPISGDGYLYVEGHDGPLVAKANNSLITFNVSGLLSGSKSILFVYPGDDNFEEYVEIVRFTISKTKATINAKGTTPKEGEDAVITVNCPRGATGYAHANINGVVYFASNVVNKARVIVPYLSRGNYEAYCQYMGDDKYSPSDESMTYVTVTKVNSGGVS